MMKSIAPWLWRAFFLFSVVSYADTTVQIGAGAFNDAGLDPRMLIMERVGNALQSVGWVVVLVLSFRRNPLLAPELCLFLAGMLFFDVQTTWVLDMPLPPYFVVWGTLIALLQIGAYLHLSARRRKAVNANADAASGAFPLWLICALAGLSALTFAHSSFSVATGAFDQSGLAVTTLPLHAWVNAFEAIGWITVIGLAFSGYARLAAPVAVFLAGMWNWDNLTTVGLSMPIPPLQVIWGPASVALLLIVAHDMHVIGKIQTRSKT